MHTEDPLALPCEACNADATEPCRWPCTAHAEALEMRSQGRL